MPKIDIPLRSVEPGQALEAGDLGLRRAARATSEATSEQAEALRRVGQSLEPIVGIVTAAVARAAEQKRLDAEAGFYDDLTNELRAFENYRHKDELGLDQYDEERQGILTRMKERGNQYLSRLPFAQRDDFQGYLNTRLRQFDGVLYEKGRRHQRDVTKATLMPALLRIAEEGDVQESIRRWVSQNDLDPGLYTASEETEFLDLLWDRHLFGKVDRLPAAEAHMDIDMADIPVVRKKYFHNLVDQAEAVRARAVKQAEDDLRDQQSRDLIASMYLPDQPPKTAAQVARMLSDDQITKTTHDEYQAWLLNPNPPVREEQNYQATGAMYAAMQKYRRQDLTQENMLTLLHVNRNQLTPAQKQNYFNEIYGVTESRTTSLEGRLEGLMKDLLKPVSAEMSDNLKGDERLRELAGLKMSKIDWQELQGEVVLEMERWRRENETEEKPIDEDRWTKHALATIRQVRDKGLTEAVEQQGTKKKKRAGPPPGFESYWSEFDEATKAEILGYTPTAQAAFLEEYRKAKEGTRPKTPLQIEMEEVPTGRLIGPGGG